MTLRVILATLAVGLLATGAQAQLVCGTDDTTAPTIFYVDLGTNAATAILTGSEAACWGMAYDHDTNTLYWNNGGTLYSSPFSLGGLTPTNLGTMTYQGANTNFVGLGYRAGKLLGTRNISTEAVYEIDTGAMTTTFRAPYPSGETDIDGLAVYNGIAYYVIDQPGNFYIFDIATGTQLGTIPSPFPGSEVFSAGAYVPGGPVSIEETSWGHIKSLYR